jgi:3-hydroxyisobutyrate dehydrogenase-like beta-hydroxyacid dehydrogenase
MTVAIIAMGEMGAGVSQALVGNGARVITSLAGRSQASAGRAADAGVEIVNNDRALVAQADFILSIVPPARAAELADRLLPYMRGLERKPVFADCNAVAPATVRQIAVPFQAEGLPFVDAGIIGPPPAPGRPGPRFYASGEAVGRFEELRKFGVDVRPLSKEVGEASALKMTYGGINKGLQALGAAMILGAMRNGVAQALWQEMQDSQAAVLQVLVRSLPKMYAKAYRWVAEMEEVAKFLQPETGGSEMLNGAAHLYENLARDYAADAADGRIALLNEFLKPGKQ